MRIAVLGANGRTGRLVIERALASGDHVSALVRDAGKLPDLAHDRLTVRVGDVCDARVLRTLLPEQDVVISTLGPRSPTRSASRIYRTAAEAVVPAMQETGVARLLVVSTALLFPPATVFERMLNWIARNNVREARAMESIIRGSGLDWTIARVGFLTGQGGGAFISRQGAMPDGAPRTISRPALAAYPLQRARDGGDARRIVGVCG